MEYTLFCEKVSKALGEFFGESTEVKQINVPKNNGVYQCGVIIKKGDSKVSPTLYLSSFYEMFCNGVEFSEIIHDILESLERNDGANINMDYFTDYDQVKDTIIYKLINLNMNSELLKEIPYVKWNDLALVFCHIFSQECIASGTVLIRNEHLKMWNVDVEEIYRQACMNTPELMKDEMLPIGEILMGAMGAGSKEALDEVETELFGEVSEGMFVLSNKRKLFGASAILYSEKVKELADRYHCGLYIIPSSIHETILIPEKCLIDASYMRQMIREVNETQVNPEDRLADTLYYYDFNQDEVRIAV